jgi:hypothetical protein
MGEVPERTSQDRGDETVEDARESVARRRRRAAVFGEVLPESTRDDRAEGRPDDRPGGSEDWLRAQVPPHHG